MGQEENTQAMKGHITVIYTQLEPLRHIPFSQGVLSIMWTVISDNLTARVEQVLLELYSAGSSFVTADSSEINVIGNKEDVWCVQQHRDDRKCHLQCEQI